MTFNRHSIRKKLDYRKYKTLEQVTYPGELVATSSITSIEWSVMELLEIRKLFTLNGWPTKIVSVGSSKLSHIM